MKTYKFKWEIFNPEINQVLPGYGHDDHDVVEAKDKSLARLAIEASLDEEMEDKVILGPLNLRITEVGPGTSSSVSPTRKTREEHLTWCKQRALEYADKGEFVLALSSMISDLSKHPETNGSSEFCGTFGTQAHLSGSLQTIPEMREFILGFN